MYICSKFQSTHPHGVRLQFIQFSLRPSVFQSTHPHGVRRESYHIQRNRNRFQSTHPHGVRPIITSLSQMVRLFQSTHPHGVRHLHPFCVLRPASFNPRTHTGCDKAKMTLSKFYAVSIHAPTRGATSHKFANAIKRRGFNPRTHTGCDVMK